MARETGQSTSRYRDSAVCSGGANPARSYIWVDDGHQVAAVSRAKVSPILPAAGPVYPAEAFDRLTGTTGSESQGSVVSCH